MTGTPHYNIFRIRGVLNGQRVVVMLDSGSTNNFIDATLVEKRGLQTEKHEGFDVKVAGGTNLSSTHKVPKLSISLGNYTVTDDFYVIVLAETNVVLGIQWMETLGEYTQSFKRLEFSFKIDDKKVVLRGMSNDGPRIVSARRMEAIFRHGDVAWSAQCLISNKVLGFESKSYQDDLLKVLDSHRVVFSDIPPRVPPDRGFEHTIELVEGAQLVITTSYKHPKTFKDEIEKVIKELLDMGHIRPSSSPFASSVVLVEKKDGTLRMCIDYRALNKKTIKNRYPIPRIDELLDELHSVVYFSKIDFRSGYHQIKLSDQDIHKTTFRCHYGHYEFLVMPFGLTNAPATFQSCMNHIFSKQLRKFLLVFFDDILIYSNTRDDHLKHIDIVISIMESQSLYAKASKYLTKKGAFRWTEEAQSVFEKLKESNVPKSCDLLQDCQDILKALKENLQCAQNQQKIYADKRRVKRHFEGGDLVYLRLQPYRQSSLKRSGVEKLKPRFYGPYPVVRKLGTVADELDLPAASRIHNVFHVSFLKKAFGTATDSVVGTTSHE
ncbi:uncharacterized protein LOC131859112 [Cryptomeria japonica]|uniref:uncharacterized protein LOC131859112 n=1 Tax=Cryptomeria japonica TaxID=3369 RepID=UPI0027DA60A7|nr:uncharacterized protein LOC131859112 [Cryptomeria japonica]